MRRYKFLILTLLLIVCGLAQESVNPDSLYIAGNEAILNEDFNAAIQIYESLLEKNNEHFNLYYNLGNAYYRMNQLGNAIWAFEKGLHLTPRDKDLKFNLDLANTRVRDRIEMPETIIFLEQYRNLKKMTTLMDLLLVGATFFMLGAFIYFLKKYNHWQSILLSRLIIVLLLLSLLIHLIALDKYFEISNKQEAIIIQPEVEVYSAPFDRKETILFRLHEGVKAEVTQDQGNWLEIELIDRKKGWIKSEYVRSL
jgi:tetratricopeptide (TPR) repeat protein